MTTMSDRELVAQEVVEGLFKDLRGRRTLKWFFDPNPDNCGPICEHFNAIDLDVQGEISAAWRKIVLAALSAAGRLREEVTGEAMQIAVEAGNADTLFQVWADMLGMHTSVIAGRAAQVLVPIIAADAERRVRAGLAAQLRDDAEANRKLGNVDAAGIFDDIAKDLEAPHVG